MENMQKKWTEKQWSEMVGKAIAELSSLYSFIRLVWSPMKVGPEIFHWFKTTEGQEVFRQALETLGDEYLVAMSFIEKVTDPESPALKEFHKFLGSIFDQAELEPLESYQEELGRKDPEVHFLCFNAKDARGEMKSCAYGSLIKDLLVVRFLATEVTNRGTGISQKVNLRLIEEAGKLGEINSLVGEAVQLSEAYWNRLEIFEAGNSMRRIYYTDSNTGEPDPSKQVFYRLPPFEWNADGTPVSDPRQPENLQVAVRGYKDKIPVVVLEGILRLWWRKWYVRPRVQFESDQAFEKHEAYVMGTLENEIIQPMKDSGQEFVMPMSKERRRRG